MIITVLLDTFPSISETFLYATIANWQKAGMDVRLLARKRGQSPHQIPFQAEITWLPSEGLPAPFKFLVTLFFLARLLFSPRKLKTAFSILRYAQGLRPKLQLAARFFPLCYYQTDLVYFPFGGLAVKYLEFMLETDSQVVFSLRGSDIHIDPLVQPYRERLQLALMAADGIHCVCDEIRLRAIDIVLGESLPNLSVIYTALSPEFLTQDIPQKKLPSPDKSMQMVSVGRLDWRKGFEHGLVAARALMERGMDFHWRIIGEGEYRLALQWAIRDMGLREKVILTGPMKHQDVLAILQSADVFFHPSIHEGISNAVLEAMALGLPVVASEVGGMREALPAESVGLLVPARDWRAMADALEKLALDPKLRMDMGVSASNFVRSRFTVQEQTRGFLTLFRQVMESEGR